MKIEGKRLSIKPRGKRLSMKTKEQLVGYTFILPWIIGFLLLVAIPLIQSFNYSLNNVRVLPQGRHFQYVGFDNYRDIFLKDMFFVETLIGFVINTILRVPIIVVFSLIIALLLNTEMKMKGFFRVIFFLPVFVASGPVMNELTQQGATTVPMMNQVLISDLLNQFLPYWLATPIVELFQEIIMILWYSGVQILIFLAAIQKVDSSLYEAAQIDGGSGWECFWKITLPIIHPMILLNAIYTIVMLANSGDNAVIELIYTNMFSATRGYGFASAMAWMYSIIQVLIVSLVYVIFKPSTSDTVKKTKRFRRKTT